MFTNNVYYSIITIYLKGRKNYEKNTFLFALVFTFVFGGALSVSAADGGPSYIPIGEGGGTSYGNYPNTNIEIKPGDLLYSKKSVSTFYVGHIGIVGTDGKVHHTLPADPSASHPVSTFLSNFDTVTLIRPNNATSAQRTTAGYWAVNNINYVTNYSFTNNPYSISNNYCSKFVWLAYDYARVDIATYKTVLYDPILGYYGMYILPSQIYNDTNNTKVKVLN
ncbi:YiiX/YebB-like N1pC/P60 family cysteine hydrolase [Bacillaceae bacterium S4-13-56]